MSLINSFKDLNSITANDCIVCLDSGGLDSAFLITKIVKEYKVKIHVLTVKLGQEDGAQITLANDIEEKIIRHYVDAQEEFAYDFVLPLIHARGVYSHQHPLSASLSRPLIAKHLVELANNVNATYALHAATPSQNSMRRFNGAIFDLGFSKKYGSPYLNENPTRLIKTQYVIQHGCSVSENRSYSLDTNLFCREFESGALSNPENFKIPEELYLWTKLTKINSEKLKITITNGVPTHINEKSYELPLLISRLNLLIGSFGLGRYHGLEEGPQGYRVLEIREAPAAFILLDCFNSLMNASFTQSILTTKYQLDPIWVNEASEGRWFGKLKMAIDVFNYSLMSKLSGHVEYNLCANNYTCTSISSKTPKYVCDRDTIDCHDIKELAA